MLADACEIFRTESETIGTN